MTAEDAEAQIVLDQVRAMEATAMEIAVRHAMSHEPFASLAEGLQERDIEAFGRIAASQQVTRSEMVPLVAKDVERYIHRLRTQTLLYPEMGAVRLAVLGHVAMVLKPAVLARLRPLWDAISRNDWQTAANELLLSNWPDKAKTQSDRRRVIELADMMRTGLAPPYAGEQ